MSVLFENENGLLLSSEIYFNGIISGLAGSPKVNSDLFSIHYPYQSQAANRKTKKAGHKGITQEVRQSDHHHGIKKTILEVKYKYCSLEPLLRSGGYLTELPKPASTNNNKTALEVADFVYEETGKQILKNISGGNFGPPTVKNIKNSKYVIPENCRFFCSDVQNIGKELVDEKFDLIVLDPPWWNKYIRRKRKKCPHAYDMMFNCDLKEIPIEHLLSDSGVVVVWCTNSPQHLSDLVESIFPKWKVKLVAKWYWLKITTSGAPICRFSEPPGKQPFEHIIIAVKDREKMAKVPPEGRLIISVPSAIHSHKPPLIEVLKPFLPEKAKSLEIFARYLLPHCTSYGNEVLRLQHECLYTFQQ